MDRGQEYRGVNFVDATPAPALHVARTRLRCAGGGGATPHAGDQLKPLALLRPEPPVAVAPDPPGVGVLARAPARPMRLIAAHIGVEGLALDDVRQLLRIVCAPVQVQVRIRLGTCNAVVITMMMMTNVTNDDDKDEDDEAGDKYDYDDG